MPVIGGVVGHLGRWLVTVGAGVIGFLMTWWIAQDLVQVDEGTAQALAGLVFGVVTLPLGVWASISPTFRRRAAAAVTAAPPAPSPTAAVSTSAVVVRVVGSMPVQPPTFVDRDELDRLDEVLGARGRAVVAAIAGGRGVGKTQLAAAYCRRADAAGWPVVVWLSAQTRARIVAGLAEVATQVGAGTAELATDDAARAGLAWLAAQSGRGVVVFDNATDPDTVAEWVPRTGGVQVVVTTTDRRFVGLGALVDVGGFTPEQAVNYLGQRTGLHDAAGAGRLAAELGWLPLALAQAAALIGGARFPSYDAYLAELAGVNVARLLGPVAGGGYPEGTTAAVMLAVGELAGLPDAEQVRQVLDVAALLSPDGVPVALLSGLAGSAPDAGPTMAGWVQVLVDRSLVSPTTTRHGVIVHRLVARILREARTRDATLGHLIDQAADLLAAAVPHDGRHEVAHRSVWAWLGPQITALRANMPADVARETAVKVFRLGAAQAYHLNDVSDVEQAVAVGEQNLADRTRVLGPDHPDTLKSRGNLADAYHAVGRYAEAIALDEQNLADRTRVLGPDHPETLASGGNLANGYWTVGRHAEAIALDEQTVADRVRILGPDHPHTLASRSNLASGYRAVGRHAEAITLYEQTLADRVRILGPDHPDTLASRSSLASGYRAVGRYAEAITLDEQTLADRVRILGAEHPDTLASRHNLAEGYAAVGRHIEAISLDEQTVADLTRVLGADHPHTLTGRHNLAEGYAAVGRTDESITLHEQNLADRTRILGPDHPHTLTSRQNLDQARRQRDNEQPTDGDSPDT